MKTPEELAKIEERNIMSKVSGIEKLMDDIFKSAVNQKLITSSGGKVHFNRLNGLNTCLLKEKEYMEMAKIYCEECFWDIELLYEKKYSWSMTSKSEVEYKEYYIKYKNILI